MASNFRTEINAFIDTNLSPDARSKALANLAISERDKLIASGQASRRFTTYVDGREDDNEYDVKGTGGGIIVYKFSFLGDAVEFALNFLRLRVPKVSGRLSQSFWVSINNRYLPPGTAINYDSIPPDATVVIGNTEAYWRRADLNLIGTHSLKYRQPKELDDCARAVRSQFGKSAIKADRVYDYQFPGKYTPVSSPLRKPYRFNSPALIISATI